MSSENSQSKQEKQEKQERLAKRTVQIIGFGFAAILTIVKVTSTLVAKEAGVEWYVIFGFVGVGVSADMDFASIITGKGRKK